MMQHGSSQGQMQQIPLEVLRNPPGQIALFPLPHQQVQHQQVQHQQVQQVQSIHTSPIMDNQMYANDTSNMHTTNMQTQDSIQQLFQRLELFKAELENKDYYQAHCEELSTHLNNENIYSTHCQKNLVACLKVCD